LRGDDNIHVHAFLGFAARGSRDAIAHWARAIVNSTAARVGFAASASAAFLHAADVFFACAGFVGDFHIAVHEVIRGHTATRARLATCVHDGFGAGDFAASAEGWTTNGAHAGLDVAFFTQGFSPAACVYLAVTRARQALCLVFGCGSGFLG
jgi:hypothetical protein